MYIKVNGRHSIYAMSRVGYTQDRIQIIIYTDDLGKIPHLHFKSERLNGCIRLDRPEYFIHGHHTSTLNTKQIRSFVKFMKSPHRHGGMTNWEYTLMLWNDNNSEVEFPEDYPMPDYLHELV